MASEPGGGLGREELQREIESRNQQLYALQTQLLCSPKADRPAIRRTIEALDEEIAQLSRRFSAAAHSPLEPRRLALSARQPAANRSVPPAAGLGQSSQAGAVLEKDVNVVLEVVPAQGVGWRNSPVYEDVASEAGPSRGDQLTGSVVAGSDGVEYLKVASNGRFVPLATKDKSIQILSPPGKGQSQPGSSPQPSHQQQQPQRPQQDPRKQRQTAEDPGPIAQESELYRKGWRSQYDSTHSRHYYYNQVANTGPVWEIPKEELQPRRTSKPATPAHPAPGRTTKDKSIEILSPSEKGQSQPGSSPQPTAVSAKPLPIQRVAEPAIPAVASSRSMPASEPNPTPVASKPIQAAVAASPKPQPAARGPSPTRAWLAARKSPRSTTHRARTAVTERLVQPAAQPASQRPAQPAALSADRGPSPTRCWLAARKPAQPAAQPAATSKLAQPPAFTLAQAAAATNSLPSTAKLQTSQVTAKKPVQTTVQTPASASRQPRALAGSARSRSPPADRPAGQPGWLDRAIASVSADSPQPSKPSKRADESRWFAQAKTPSPASGPSRRSGVVRPRTDHPIAARVVAAVCQPSPAARQAVPQPRGWSEPARKPAPSRVLQPKPRTTKPAASVPPKPAVRRAAAPVVIKPSRMSSGPEMDGQVRMASAAAAERTARLAGERERLLGRVRRRRRLDRAAGDLKAELERLVGRPVRDKIASGLVGLLAGQPMLSVAELQGPSRLMVSRSGKLAEQRQSKRGPAMAALCRWARLSRVRLIAVAD